MRAKIRLSVEELKNKIVDLYEVSGKKHLIITGKKGSGKSTLLREFLRDRNSYGGIITRLILDSKGHSKYVVLEDALDRKSSAMIGSINSFGTSMNPIIQGFEELGVDILKYYRKSSKEMIIFDEIGYLESHTVDYREEIFRCFNDKKVIAVVRKSNSSLIKQVLSLEDIFIVDLDNI